MAMVGNFLFFLRLTWEFLSLERERGGSVCWPKNKIIDGQIGTSYELTCGSVEEGPAYRGIGERNRSYSELKVYATAPRERHQITASKAASRRPKRTKVKRALQGQASQSNARTDGTTGTTGSLHHRSRTRPASSP